MKLSFVRAHREDLPKIVTIYNQIIPSRLATADLDPVTVADRTAWFDSFDQHHPLWVIKDAAGTVIGWVGLEPFYGRAAFGHTSEIAIYIDQTARHQGVGRRALEYVIAQLPQLEITAIVAYIFGRNEPSLRLFRDFAFQKWGELPRVAELDGVQRDLVIMGRRFDRN